MKKLIKWSVIAGIVLCLLGTGIFTAGVMMGGIQDLGDFIDRKSWEIRAEDTALRPCGEHLPEMWEQEIFSEKF